MTSEDTTAQLLASLDEIARLLAIVREIVIDSDPEMLRKANGDE